MDDLTSFYMYQLEINNDAQDYVKQRKLNKDAIKHFKIGYAPLDNHLSIRYLKSKGHSNEDILLSGVAHNDLTRELVDNYSHRLIFPILDSDGHTWKMYS